MSAEDDLPPLQEPDEDLVRAAREGIRLLLLKNGRRAEDEDER